MTTLARLAALAAVAAAHAAALAGDSLVGQFTRTVSYTDFSGFEQNRINVFVSIAPDSDPDLIFDDIMILRTVRASDVGSVYEADLTAPGQADAASLLINDENNILWFGADSDGGGQYDIITEASAFTGNGAPDGTTLPGPDLAGFVPTRLELQLNSLSLNWDGFFSTAISTNFTVRVFAINPPPCNPADLAAPVGVLDLADVATFALAFLAGEPAADLAPPAGLYDLADVTTFVSAFLAGCP